MMLRFPSPGRRLAFAAVALIGACVTTCCAGRSPSTDARDQPKDGARPDALGFCTGQSKLLLAGETVPMGSASAVVNRFINLPHSPAVTVSFTFDVRFLSASGEHRSLVVYYRGGDLYDCSETLTKDSFSATNFNIYLVRCESALCNTRVSLEELSSSTVAVVAGLLQSDSTQGRVSLCLNVKASDAAANPNLSDVSIYLEAVQAEYKTTWP